MTEVSRRSRTSSAGRGAGGVVTSVRQVPFWAYLSAHHPIFVGPGLLHLATIRPSIFNQSMPWYIIGVQYRVVALQYGSWRSIRLAKLGR